MKALLMLAALSISHNWADSPSSAPAEPQASAPAHDLDSPQTKAAARPEPPAAAADDMFPALAHRSQADVVPPPKAAMPPGECEACAADRAALRGRIEALEAQLAARAYTPPPPAKTTPVAQAPVTYTYTAPVAQAPVVYTYAAPVAQTYSQTYSTCDPITGQCYSTQAYSSSGPVHVHRRSGLFGTGLFARRR
jgi:hypothetical protein